MSDRLAPLVSIQLLDFKFLQEIVWTEGVDPLDLGLEQAGSVRRLVAEELVTEKGRKAFSSARGRRAIAAQRYHETEEAVVLLRRDLDDA